MAGKQKTPGRPRERDRDHLTSEARFELRLSPADKARLAAAAKAEGQPLGEWLRDLGLKRAKRVLPD